MKKSEFVKQIGGLKIGTCFQVVNGPQSGKIFEITSISKDAIEATFRGGEWDGQREQCAKEIIYDALDGKFEHSLKWI